MAAPTRPLYAHIRKASHFARWELPEFARHFRIVDAPSPDVPLLSFGPDVFEEAATLPASQRFAVLLPGFSFNPVRDVALRERQLRLMDSSFDLVFINPGPLEIAYRGVRNVAVYSANVDVDLARMHAPRTRLDSLLHVSQDNPQKDWRRSESIMHKTGLRYEVYPSRDTEQLVAYARRQARRDRIVGRVGVRTPPRLPVGYVSHRDTLARYRAFDGFVHVARDVRHPEFIDGKYTAALLEAGATGALLFWHDTWGLGSGLETVFELPLSTETAARRILEIRAEIDVRTHSLRTAEEIRDRFNVRRSVQERVDLMLPVIG